MGPARREAVTAWQEHPFCCDYVLRERLAIEREFAALCATSEGLCGLPSFVRRLKRLRPWVGPKIIWHNAALDANASPPQRQAA